MNECETLSEKTDTCCVPIETNVIIVNKQENVVCEPQKLKTENQNTLETSGEIRASDPETKKIM